MNWLLAGLLAGSLITSQHKDEETCLGRKAMLEKQKVERLTCVELRIPLSMSGIGTYRLCSNGQAC